MSYTSVVVGIVFPGADPVLTTRMEYVHVALLYVDALLRVLRAESDALTRRIEPPLSSEASDAQDDCAAEPAHILSSKHTVSLLSALRAQFRGEHSPPSSWSYAAVAAYLALKLTPCAMLPLWPRASLRIGLVSMLVSAWLQFDNFTRDRSAARGNALYAEQEEQAEQRLCPRWYVFIPASLVVVTGVIACMMLSSDAPSDSSLAAVLGAVCCPVFAMFVKAVGWYSPQDNDIFQLFPSCKSGTVSSGGHVRFNV